MAKQRRTFSPDFKFQLVLELLSDEKSAARLCREYQVSETSLSRWRQHFLKHGARVFDGNNAGSAQQKQIAELERMVGRLTMELGAAKKALSWLDSL